MLNVHIAEVLDDMRDGWSVRAEMLGAFRNRKIPDILVTENRKPRSSETETEPARRLAADAVQKTSQIAANCKGIRAAVSVAIPAKFRSGDRAESIRAGIRSARFR